MLPDINTAELRRLAAEQARKSQRHLHLALFVIHAFLYIAALVVMAALAFGLPWVFDSLWNNIDLSMIVAGLFVGWGIGVGLHGGALLIESDWMERRLKQQAVSGVFSRSLLDADDERETLDKAKRNLTNGFDFSLNDDGELEQAEPEPTGGAYKG